MSSLFKNTTAEHLSYLLIIMRQPNTDPTDIPQMQLYAIK